MRVKFPDVDAFVVGLLNSAGFRAGTRMQSKNVDSLPFVRVLNNGGSRISLEVEEVVFRFEAWAPTDEEASELAEEVRSEVSAWETERPGNPLRVDERSRPASYPDPESSWGRYFFNAALRMRGK